MESKFFFLGCFVRVKKVLSISEQLLRVFFSTFWGQKKWIFFWKHCRKFPHFFDIFDDFVYCWTFEILHLHVCLLLNLWTFFTAQPLRLSVAAEPLRLCPGLCICLLLNLWIFFYCWTFEIMPWIMYLFDAEALRTFSSKQNHQKSGPLIKRHQSEITDISIIPTKI